MRRILLGVFLLSSAPLISTQPGSQPSPQSLLAAERDAFVTAYSRPWRRVVRFILFPGDKKKEITGAVEDTVYSPFHQKRTYSSPKESFSIYTLPEGTFTDRKNAVIPGMLRFALQGMSPQLVPQLLPKDRILAIAALPDTHFSCYQTERRDDSGFIAISSRSVPSFCFDHNGTLRTVTLEHIVTAVNAQLLLNQRYVPSRVLVATEERPLVSLETVLLEPLPEGRTIERPPEASYPGERSEISPCDSGGADITGDASSFGTRGVLLDIHIDKQGKVDRTSVITSASSLFEREAQDEVRKRTYSPCVISGKATDFGLTTLWWGRDRFRFRKGPFSRF
ncbi:energy transducer TonB [Terriglobus albidus]|uniref:energy transducer TonB n=1 Tax=Terriglobus albidus TaxID=1592106 RepID=UPI0021DF9626|nr:energy transducer TonB [Terriglobus albidus]